MCASVRVPALVYSPQVNTGKGGAALVSLAGVWQAPNREPLLADQGNPISWLAVHRQVASVETQIPHTACGKKSSLRKKKTQRRFNIWSQSSFLSLAKWTFKCFELLLVIVQMISFVDECQSSDQARRKKKPSVSVHSKSIITSNP